MRRTYVIPIAIVIFVVAISYVISIGGIGPLPFSGTRLLAQIYLYTTYNPSIPNLTVGAPEAVTAIVWDYRGLDTLFETSVMFLAIISALTLFRGIELPVSQSDEDKGMSIIAKTMTRIILPMILVVAASLGFHGHLTPGGGFQGGATAAVASLLIVIIFSVYFLSKRLSINAAILMRSLGLLGIGIATFLVLVMGLIMGLPAYIFQNQPKFLAPVGLSSIIGNGDIITGGTLLIFNISETFAVFMGFSALFLLLFTPEESIRKVIEKEMSTEGE